MIDLIGIARWSHDEARVVNDQVRHQEEIWRKSAIKYRRYFDELY